MSRRWRDDELPLQDEPGSPYGRTRLPPYGRESAPEVVTESPEHGRSGKGKKQKFWKRPTLGKRKGTMNSMDTSGLNTENKRSSGGGGEMKRIDFVLVYENKTLDETTSSSSRRELEEKMEMREKFETLLETEEGMELQKDVIGEYMFIKIHTPFDRLCEEAEKTKLNLPLIGCEIYDDAPGCITRLEDKYMVTDDEVDFVSAAFVKNKLKVFEGHENADSLFRPALRSLLTNHILINMDIRKEKKATIEDPMAKKGLPFLIMKGVYTDAYLLHDETAEDPAEKEELEEKQAKFGSRFSLSGINFNDESQLLNEDTRKDLNKTWPRFHKYQPLWKVRNYFGEKIALYFAWSGTLTSTLWIPTLFGLGVFFYGLYLSATKQMDDETPNNATGVVESVKLVVQDSINVVKSSFDNDVTPYYALCICLWGTIFLEVWKRKNATLAYEWDVDTFEDTEVDRPQFFGTSKKADPVIPGEETWYYPMSRQFLKFMTSCSMLIFMVSLVIISAAGVIVYRVIVSVDYCADATPTNCLIISAVISSLLNAVSILILGKLYDKLAVMLTNWENHRTQTQYDDALIIKLFAFQFVNSYTTCFYIAFFRGYEMDNGVLGLGQKYQDSCGTDGNCMAMLSFQVLVLMLMKPLPKFLKDIVIPFLRKMWRKHIKKRVLKCCCCCKKKVDVPQADKVHLQDYLERERLKPDLGDFTLGEYTEKVIVYGFLMLFAASFPLAPLIALLLNLIDIRVDAKRMLWMYRRPVAFIAQDIGMWYGILQFINIVGVISNAFLIAFTSSWGAKYTTAEKLWIVIGFEHIVFSIKFMVKVVMPDVPPEVSLNLKRHICFAVKFVIAVMIPDVPRSVTLAQKREKYQVARIMEKAGGGVVPPMGSRLSKRGAPIRPEHRLDLSAAPPREEDEESDVPRYNSRKNKRRGSKRHSRSYDDDDVVADDTLAPVHFETSADFPPTYIPPGDYDLDPDYSDHYHHHSRDSRPARRLAPITPRKHRSRNSGHSVENPSSRRQRLSYDEDGDTYLDREEKFVNPYTSNEPRYDKRDLFHIPEYSPRPAPSHPRRYQRRYDDYSYDDESAA